MKDIYFLTISEIQKIHEAQIKEHGGAHGIRDKNLLESAIHAPQSGTFDSFLHKDIFEMAAAYAYHIIKNHPFVDGNKRTGMLATLIFLEVNDTSINLKNEHIVFLGLQIATSRITKIEVADFLRKHCMEA